MGIKRKVVNMKKKVYVVLFGLRNSTTDQIDIIFEDMETAKNYVKECNEVCKRRESDLEYWYQGEDMVI